MNFIGDIIVGGYMDDITNILDNFKGADTIPALLARSAERFQNRIAIRSKIMGIMVEKTYLQLKKDSDAVTVSIEKMGIKQEKIAIIGKISYEWIVTYFGVTGSKNIVVPIDKDLSAADIERLLDLADVSAIFFDKSHMDVAEYIKKQCKNIKLFVCFQNTEGFISLSDFIKTQYNNVSDINIQAEQTAMIVFASGSDGVSKGVMLSHQNICHDIICSANLIGKDTFVPGERTMPVLPTHHMLEITCEVLTLMLYYGMTMCIGDGLKNFSKNLKQFKPNMLILVPMIVESIYKRIWREAKQSGKDRKLKLAIKLSNFLLKLKIDIRHILFRNILDSLGGELRVIVCGGSYMDPDLVNKFGVFGIKLLNGYGITECSPVVACNPANNIKKDSVGLIGPAPYCQVKIKDNEILVRGSIVMQGYYKDEDGTKEVFDGEWFRTGDLGYIDKENYLYITGLKKDLIILKDGNNISPVELEQAIEAYPLVETVLVYAVHNDKNDILAAAVYPNYKYAMDNGIEEPKAAIEKLIDEINMSWPRYKRIVRVKLYKEAFDKRELRKLKRTNN